MISGDMSNKRRRAMAKVHAAIKDGGGTTLLSTGITGDDARLAKAAVDAGARLLEPNHPAVALARGFRGVTTMHAAEKVRHRLPLRIMAEVVEGVRNVVGDDIFITVGVPGGFTELLPTVLREEDFLLLSQAGADGLHIHKSTLPDLEDVVRLAHRYGLSVDAYIGHPDDLHTFGLPALDPEEVARVAKDMQAVGCDMIGLMTGMSYEGVAAGDIPAVIKERLAALVESVAVPTLAEGGINPSNFKACRNSGGNILVVGTSIDDQARQAVTEAVKVYLG
ncbi:MAG: histidine biosynthesis protein [Planctomycetes bacterium]|nr:histidine biosynthesis protein [Planctomycetota bacterium]